ncbi:hypothetical protein GT019_00485 [Paenibacillus sp. T1]|uniref:Uncharacterized protein n=2 Tax=Paenibacillus glycinis TaxID=2697035 RepID=A0ABW9XIA6_9BACL|nr:hypothetical protein [Paenibacillus glycinis]
MPVPFGCKCQWYAVKTTDTRAVADLLKLADRQRANWRTGIDGAYRGYYFVAPPVRGWTLVVNASMPDLSAPEAAGPLPTLAGLSLAFGEACYFATHRVVDYQAWIRSSNGEIVRGYAYLGERGETLLDQGELSREEREANLAFTGMDAEEPVSPNEADVLRMAGLWSVDPSVDSNGGEARAGVVGIR